MFDLRGNWRHFISEILCRCTRILCRCTRILCRCTRILCRRTQNTVPQYTNTAPPYTNTVPPCTNTVPQNTNTAPPYTNTVPPYTDIVSLDAQGWKNKMLLIFSFCSSTSPVDSNVALAYHRGIEIITQCDPLRWFIMFHDDLFAEIDMNYSLMIDYCGMSWTSWSMVRQYY